MPGQRVLLFRNDKWFNAYDPASRGMGTDCPPALHMQMSPSTWRRAYFYGQAGQVIQSNVVQQGSTGSWRSYAAKGIQGAYQNVRKSASAPTGGPFQMASSCTTR